jgi:hypothetical protein
LLIEKDSQKILSRLRSAGTQPVPAGAGTSAGNR